MRAGSTFGNPELADKFNRNVYVEEIKKTAGLGAGTPAPNQYNYEVSCFSVDKPDHPQVTMPKDRRNFDRILKKKDADNIPCPGYHHTDAYMNGEYGTSFTRNPQK